MTLPALDPDVLFALRVGGTSLLALTFLLGIRSVLLRQLHRWASRTDNSLDDVVVHAIRTPSLFWAVAGAVDITVRVNVVSPDIQEIVSRALLVVVLLSATLVASNIGGGAITHVLRRQGPEGAVPGLAQVVVRTVVLMLGGMVVLNAMGVEIAPLLTALGVGGLALALALQETLSNFFAGLHILMERPFHIGHFIRLEDGREGHVLDIGWRTTRIRTLDDDVVIVPNSKIAGSTLVNCHMPIPRTRVRLRVVTAYGSDPDHVGRMLLEELAAGGSEWRHLLAEPAPRVLLMRFGDIGLEHELRFFIDDVAAEHNTVDYMNRRIYRRFRAEGLSFPFPTHNVVLHREEA